MKISKFNIAFTHDNFYFILNTNSKQIIRFPIEQKKLIEDFFLEEEITNKSNLTDVLLKKGFIIPKEFDETEGIRSRCYELVNSNTLFLTMMPTYTCNLACAYCFQHHIPGSIISNTVMENVINAVEKSIGKYKSMYVEWFGGEPLLARKQVLHMNRRFKEICKGAKIPYVSRITTNGYFLDIKTFKELLEYNCFVYYISLDGGKELHDKQRPCKNGEGSYDVIMENLKCIKNSIDSRRFRVEIRVNCSKKSFADFEKFVSDFSNTFGDDRRFTLVIETINDWSERTENMSKEGVLLGHPGLEELGAIARNYSVRLNSMETYSLETRICQAAKRNGYSIFYDGSIHKCQMAQETGTYKLEDVIGNVTNTGDFCIDNHKEEKWVTDALPDDCMDCKVLPICLGKKCVFQSRIKGEPCIDVEQKFIDSFMASEQSRIEQIPLYVVPKGD